MPPQCSHAEVSTGRGLPTHRDHFCYTLKIQPSRRKVFLEGYFRRGKCGIMKR